MKQSVRISSFQLNLAKYFRARGPNYVMDASTVRVFRQGTVRSLIVRQEQILERIDGSALRLTDYGHEVCQAYEKQNVNRQNESLDLSTWLGSFLHQRSAEEKKKRGGSKSGIPRGRRQITAGA